MRTLIYARFSSDNQNSKSTADQIADCRAYAVRQGWEIVDAFADDAIGGGAGIGGDQRPALNAALERIEQGGIDQLLAESTSRVARNRGDAYTIRERIEFAGARLFTLSTGHVDSMREWAHGYVDEQQRKDLAFSIRRGQRGTVADGRVPAGLAFGYRIANRLDGKGGLVRGLREIDADEAAIVRRIFEEYAAGQSPRAIAGRLNDEGVPGPRGATWRASTIRGDRSRQNGMLRNRLYAGEIVHHRTSKALSPRTRKTLIRPQPEADWSREDAPALRIVPPELWDRVQAELQRTAPASAQLAVKTRRPRHLLSGLANCGICGGGWSIISGKQWGCGRNRDGGGCGNNRRIETPSFEKRVLDGLREKMLDPAAVALFVKEYHAENARLEREFVRDRARLNAVIADAAARIDRLVSAIERGADIEEVREALTTARGQRQAAEAELAELDAANVVSLHPRLADQYRTHVEELTAALADPHARIEAVPKLRSLIERIVVTPAREGRGVDLKLEGRITNLLAMAAGRKIDLGARTVKDERVKGIEPSS